MRAKLRVLGALVCLSIAGCGKDDGPCHPSGADVEDVNQAIKNGTCAAENTAFEDTYECSRVEGPCPGSSGEASAKVAEDPSRLEDPDLAWSVAQLDACTCSCCHDVGGVGDHRWSSNFTPAWTDSAETRVLRILLEPVPSDIRIAASDSNGLSMN